MSAMTYGGVRAGDLRVGDVVEVDDVPLTVADVVVLPNGDSHVRQPPRAIVEWSDGTVTGLIDPDIVFLRLAPEQDA